MSVSGISTTSFSNDTNQNVISKQKAIQQEFQQLGQDLQSGNLSAAQSDYATLEQMVPQLDSNSSSDPRVKAFQQLEQDLQSGNLSAAQQDYSNIQQMFQKVAEHRHHHHGISGAPGGVNPVSTQPSEAEPVAAPSSSSVSVTA